MVAMGSLGPQSQSLYFIQLISSLNSICSPDVPLPRGEAPSGSGDLHVDTFGADITRQPGPGDPVSRVQRRLRGRGRACFLSTQTLLTVSGVNGSPESAPQGSVLLTPLVQRALCAHTCSLAPVS